MFRSVQLKTPSLARGLRGVEPQKNLSLEKRLAALNVADTELTARVNIGYVRMKTKKEAFAEVAKNKLAVRELKKDKELQKLCSTGNHKIDMDEVKNEWCKTKFYKDAVVTADHYNVFSDLFEYGYFQPQVYMKIGFPISEEECSPVHLGNIISCEDTGTIPEVHYEAEPNQLFTLVFTSLDSHLESCENEYLNWMVGNIPGNDISKGTTVCDYMRPFMPKGAGYHRFSFVLYKQEKKIDFSKYQRPAKTACLRERTFKTIDFYRALQDEITPCGIAFFQSTWHDCLMDFFHNTLEMKVPVFEHIPLPAIPERFKKFPENESFNKYIDRFRDPKEIAEDIYCRRLKKLDPFKEEVPDTKFPHAHPMSLEYASWVRSEIREERNFQGKFRHMKRFSLHPEGRKPVYKPAPKIE